MGNRGAGRFIAAAGEAESLLKELSSSPDTSVYASAREWRGNADKIYYSSRLSVEWGGGVLAQR